MKETKELVELGSGITGNLTSLVIGYLVNGVSGGIVGSVAGPLVQKMAGDFLQRTLSRQERRRVGAGMTYAINRVWQQLIDEDEPITATFFEERETDRSPAEEILEGVLLTCQREHEEKKTRFIANIFANAAFTELSPATLNEVLRIAEGLSYRQLCILSCLGADQSRIASIFLRSEESLRAAVGESGDADFIHRSLLEMSEGMGLLGYDHGPPQVVHGKSSFPGAEPGKLTSSGKTCVELMELNTVPLEDLRELLGRPSALDAGATKHGSELS